MIDTLIFIVVYIFLMLGVISFITMIDELLLGGIISDGVEWFLDRVADIYFCIEDKIKKRKRKRKRNRSK